MKKHISITLEERLADQARRFAREEHRSVSQVVEIALALCRRYGVHRQAYFDMQLVATMQVNGIPTLITENTADFEAVREIRTWNALEDAGGQR